MVRNRNAKRNNNSHPRPVDRKEGTLKRWNKPSDIPMDEEDQFHASRDRILLEGDDVHSDDEGDEEEVFALKGIPDSEEEDEGEVESEEDEEDEDETPLPSAATSKKPSGKQRKQAPPSSDEQSDSESEEEGWGRSKAAYYSSNAAQLSSDDEEANEMEEQEANRLQAKIREVLNDDDFGLADVANIVMEQEDDEPVPVITEVLPKDKESLLRHLERTNPEALALARDWDDVARTLWSYTLIRLEDEQSDAITSGMLHLYYQALLQYAITLAFYLYLRSSEQYSVHPEQLRSHPIMGRLLTLKQHIATLEDLDVAGSEEEDEDEDEDEDSDNDLAAIRFPKKWGAEASDELLNLFEEMKQFRGADEPSIKKEKKKARVPPEEPPKKKAKDHTGLKTCAVVAHIRLGRACIPSEIKAYYSSIVKY
ncbi:hypothetical protein EW026_g4680 [Hermanssonia centrifuga]|uniref:Something about silencing protein 10 n=1 Tax=Hermanssonia centrifuga TaxID=98765 RepID=A0A4S4KGD4_9APHY|nr:hypothetical protein EW026_g4680 [Hermanssonia centrifuga]